MTTDMSQLRHSMHEMYETIDLTSFGDAMDDININVKTSASPPPDEARDDDFLFIDCPLRSVGNIRSTSGATTTTRPIQVTIGGRSTMRRSMSMASLPSEAERQKKTFSLLAMVPDIHTIAAIKEEEDEENMGAKAAVTAKSSQHDGEPNVQVKTKNGTDAKNNDMTSTANRRRSRRASQGPLKSSLKSSSTSITSHLSESSQHSMKRNVSFSNLEIRSYGVTLGDTPTLTGPPISLDWKYDPQATQVHDIDQYEQHRSITPDNPTPSNPRRTKDELFIHPSHRQYLLMRDAGFSRMQIKLATEEAQRAAKERQKSAKRRLSLDDMLEKANDKLKAIARFHRRKS